MIRRTTKTYNDVDVLSAATARLDYLFTHFDNVCFAVSGGKDSGVLVQLGCRVAQRLGKTFSVMFIDLEAMYDATERFVLSLRDLVRPQCRDFYWVCLPLCEENATSILSPEFITWDPTDTDKWVRSIPSGAITTDNNPFDFYRDRMSFEDFVADFSPWLHKRNAAQRTAIVIGIRTDESLRRFLAVASDTKPCYEGRIWTTRVGEGHYNAYPIYDWRVEDIWGAVSQLGLDYNRVYEDMYKLGIPLSRQRICQPFGSAAKAGLDQFRAIEPDTWERLVQRVAGVNFGAIYCRSSLFGNMTSTKPKHLTWEQYAVFLLESVGLYEPRIMDRYYRKIKYYMLWAVKNERIPYGALPQDGDRHETCWKNVARALEKNDFYLTHLSFGLDKAGDALLLELRHKHRLFGDGILQPKIAKKLREVGVP